MADGDKDRGLYQKYEVRKLVPHTDQRGEEGFIPVPLRDPVFVLNYAKDPHARVALRAYIESCREAGYLPLANDLTAELIRTKPQ